MNETKLLISNCLIFCMRDLRLAYYSTRSGVVAAILQC